MRYLLGMGLLVGTGCAVPRAPERPPTLYGYCGLEVENVRRLFPNQKPSSESHNGPVHALTWRIDDPDKVTRYFDFTFRERPGTGCDVRRSTQTLR